MSGCVRRLVRCGVACCVVLCVVALLGGCVFFCCVVLLCSIGLYVGGGVVGLYFRRYVGLYSGVACCVVVRGWWRCCVVLLYWFVRVEVDPLPSVH